jgi:hypothetical protein
MISECIEFIYKDTINTTLHTGFNEDIKPVKHYMFWQQYAAIITHT